MEKTWIVSIIEFGYKLNCNEKLAQSAAEDLAARLRAKGLAVMCFDAAEHMQAG